MCSGAAPGRGAPSTLDEAFWEAPCLGLVTTSVFCCQCDYLEEDTGSSRGAFSPSVLQVAAGDLRQLMATFSRVYEADLRAYCSRDPPHVSADAHVFQRTQQLLKTFITVQEDWLDRAGLREGA